MAAPRPKERLKFEILIDIHGMPLGGLWHSVWPRVLPPSSFEHVTAGIQSLQMPFTFAKKRVVVRSCVSTTMLALETGGATGLGQRMGKVTPASRYALEKHIVLRRPVRNCGRFSKSMPRVSL